MRTVGVGHAFPTGDLFRRLRVRAWTEDAEGRLVAEKETLLSRVFDHDAAPGTPRTKSDTRIEGRRTLVLELDDTSGTTASTSRNVRPAPCASPWSSTTNAGRVAVTATPRSSSVARSSVVTYRCDLMRARTSPLPSFFPCIVAVLGMACTTPQRDTRTPAPVATTSDASPPTVTKAGDAGAATSRLSGATTAKLEDAPLPWGTRPLGNGPLWTLVDGMCIHMETWPVSNGVMVVYGNALGPYTRGGDPTLARIDETGLDPTSLPLPPREKTDSFYGGSRELSGTWPSAFVLAGATRRADAWPNRSTWTHDTNGWTVARGSREERSRRAEIFTRSRPRPWKDGSGRRACGLVGVRDDGATSRVRGRHDGRFEGRASAGGTARQA
ncbi:MAG: hypothetical protein U0169_03255 [Polyangiaceae bacterium]